VQIKLRAEIISFSNREGATVSGDTQRPLPIALGLRADGSEIVMYNF
jgi:hypothetical protein